MINYDSVPVIKAFLEAHDFAPQKKFGQNFLINGNARKKLISALGAQPDDEVWEVGGGLGAMTTLLLDTGCNLTVFEIDTGYVKILNSFFGGRDNFRIIEGNVLKTWKNAEPAPKMLFGNLPYNIAATLFADFIEEGFFFENGVITVQKDVERRMTAAPGSKDYSSFTVLCQSAYDVKLHLNLPGSYFWPQPNVTSASVVFKKALKPCEHRDFLPKFLRGIFSSRRKTVKNNLCNFCKSLGKDGEIGEKIISAAKIDENSRSETFSVTQLLEISDIAYEILFP
ncbi:MAG: ribosomal RNA small subunit methyltransferase A [Spirochaetaceae bacterium]|nr:ribosomal RNA small subunit methyltransferase A [Spirochaetaceae bacterium]